MTIETIQTETITLLIKRALCNNNSESLLRYIHRQIAMCSVELSRTFREILRQQAQVNLQPYYQDLMHVVQQGAESCKLKARRYHDIFNL
jgi:hypothetical protein